MECSCDFSDYNWDEESVQLYTKQTRKAKKEHICNECGVVIPINTSYIYEKFMYDNLFFQHKTCMDCESVRTAFYPTGGYTFSELWETVLHNIDSCNKEIPESCLRKLSSVA